MSNPRILIVDDDPSILKMVAFVLEKYGYTIETASDGEVALNSIGNHTPDLVITDVNMPRMDGWALVRALRARPDTAFTPVIFLTAQSSEEDRMLGFRLGGDDYLAKPFHFEELKLRVRNMLRRASASVSKQKAADAVSAPAGIRGSLRDIGIASVLMLLEMEKKTGVLTVDAGTTKAIVHVNGGRLLRAELEGTPQPRGLDVIYGFLAWADGQFEFAPGDVELNDEIRTPTMHILMESARLADERKRADGA